METHLRLSFKDPMKINLELWLSDSEIQHLKDFAAAEVTTETQLALQSDAIDKVVNKVLTEIYKEESKPVEVKGLFDWEGEVCGNEDCKHTSNLHSNRKGLCSRESCTCFIFKSTGRYL